MSSKILMLAAVVALMASAMAVDSAAAGKPPKVSLSYQLYSSVVDNDIVVEYTVQSKGGNMDLAVSHECYTDDELVQSRTNRLYWSGKGQDKAGTWDLNVQAGSECFAVVVDLSQSTSSAGSASVTSSGYAEVSASVRYIVE